MRTTPTLTDYIFRLRGFEQMTDDEAAAFLESKMAEIEAEVTAAEIMEKVNAGRAVIVKQQHALAVVQPENEALGQFQMHLWLLWVSPEDRGRRVGRRFVRQLIRAHASTRWARVICFGARRSRFFQRCGFKVVERFGDEGGRTLEQRR